MVIDMLSKLISKQSEMIGINRSNVEFMHIVVAETNSQRGSAIAL